ncbi:MAG: acyltransferase [Phycisphaerales bacterium]
MTIVPPRLASALVRVPGSIRSRIRIRWLRALGARIGQHCAVKDVMLPQNPWDVHMGDHVTLDSQVVLLATGEKRDRPRIVFGSRIYCNRFTMFDATELIEVGNDTMIGPGCYITDHDHGTALGQKMHEQPLVSVPTRIGRDVWLGAHAVVLKGVTIGDGAIVAACTVVTRDVAAGAIVAGSPVRMLGMR